MVVTISFTDSTFISEDGVVDILYQDGRISLNKINYGIEFCIKDVSNILITENSDGN